MIFAALPGTVTDGRKFIDQAINNGAAAILTTPDVTASVPVIESDNPRLDYALLAQRFFPKQPATLVAMTGTNGKSSTVEFLRQIWQHAGLKAACFGTLGVKTDVPLKVLDDNSLKHTTPDALALHQTLQGLAKAGITHAALEASSHGLSQYRLDGAQISAAGFTNLTQDHFDYHGTMEAYFTAKARLFTELTPKDAPVIINTDGDYGQRLAALCHDRGQAVMQLGWRGADIRIDELTPSGYGQKLRLIIDDTPYQIFLPLTAEFQALNALSALGLAIKTGVDLPKALSALELLQAVEGRMQYAGQTAQGAPIFVDFAHTEDGLDKLLRGLRPHIIGKLIIVFGCGGDRDSDKRAKMGAVAAHLADVVIVTDDNPRTEDPSSIRAAVMQGCPEAMNIAGRAEAIDVAIGSLGPEDGLVIAGKGHEQGQIIGTVTYPFNDAEQVQKVLNEAQYV